MHYTLSSMGTMIHLSVGAFQIDLGKNSSFADHTALFQSSDLTDVLDYGYDEPVEMRGYSRKLGVTVGRLELLGYTLESIKMEFLSSPDKWDIDRYYPKRFSFSKLLKLCKEIKIGQVTGKWSEYDRPLFVPDQILKFLPAGDHCGTGGRPDFWDLEILFGGLSPYSILRLLAENPSNLDISIIWPFGDLVDNGWAKDSDFEAGISLSEQFLIVTEGSSDTHVIKKALSLLKPEICDFFRFIDMEDGYPFTGTGNLFNFTRGLISIGLSTPTIILYDNDAEGIRKFEDAKKLNLPRNISVTKLPDLAALKKFTTIGPHGVRKSDINGRAASIECYLDLSAVAGTKESRIRWSSYVEVIDKYQGAIEGKTAHVKQFLKLKSKESDYDFSKIEEVLSHLYKLCLKMKK